ncbi:NAD-binding protein [Halobaculum sp. MBLA0147]|uniref:NAD-binding protein n=1 Tax=Halobaculum sp. MBLA0147 TaxID=3079934 RepID=UPI003524E0D3
MSSVDPSRVPGLGRVAGVRVAVLATTVVAVLSVVTGVANIVTPPRLIGPLVPVVPDTVRSAAGFTGTLTGFALFVAATGMRRGLRAGWYASVALLPITLAQGVIQTSQLSVPLVVASLVALPSVAYSRERFDRPLSLSTSQLAGATAIAAVQLYGTAGAFALREQFSNVETVLDAFYFTLVTASTVGYGDVTAGSQTARLFTMSLVVLGTASFGIAIGVLITPAIEARFSEVLGRVTQADLELLEDHVIVLGYGDLTEPILNELSELSAEFVVVTPDEAQSNRLAGREFLTLVGDPSDEETLDRVGLDRATAVVAATNNDAEDALAVLTARHVAPSVRIVAAATDRENVNKLRRAGADTVISPASIGGHLLVQSALGAEGMEDVAAQVIGTDRSDTDSPPRESESVEHTTGGRDDGE